MRKSLFLLLILALPLSLGAQSWKYFRNEFVFGLGASNSLGELGGANQIGTNGVKDLEFSMTRPTVALGWRYKLSPSSAIRANAIYGRLNGDDALTAEKFRNNRNLNFRTPLVEIGLQFELYPFGEKTGYSYRLKGVRGNKSHFLSPYIFGGVAGIWFNPQGKDASGNWVKLYPLHTEGQGLPGGPDQYKRITIALPVGIGVKYALNREWSLGLELGGRMTFTDYIDDVSGVYYDNNAIATAYGAQAAYFADPSLDPTLGPGDGILTTQAGQQRGDASDNDSYMFAILSINYKFLKGRMQLPKF